MLGWDQAMNGDEIFCGVCEVAVEFPSATRAEAGLVLKWRRRGDVWEGLVSRETADGRLVTEWLPALVLAPLTSRAG